MSESRTSDRQTAGQQEAPSFRDYRSEDLERCAEIAAGGWPEIFAFAGKEGAASLMRFMVEFYGATATWREIACVSDNIVGVLFGKINLGQPRFGWMRTFLTGSQVYLKLLLGSYGKISKRMKIMRLGISDDRKIRANSPKADGEVTFFVVDAALRGRGIGRQLMDRFVASARSKNAKKITVYTTNPGSNWEFYNRYGFKQYSAFRDAFTSFALKEEVKALIFVLDLQ